MKTEAIRFPCVWAHAMTPDTHAATAADGSVVADVVVISIFQHQYFLPLFFCRLNLCRFGTLFDLWCEYDFFYCETRSPSYVACFLHIYYARRFLTCVECMPVDLKWNWFGISRRWRHLTCVGGHRRRYPKKMCCQCSGNALERISSSAFTSWFYRLRLLCALSLFFSAIAANMFLSLSRNINFIVGPWSVHSP